MKEDLILVGAGGHCHAMIDVIEATDQYNIIGILDKPEFLNSDILGYKVIGNDSNIAELAQKHKNFVIAIGQINNSSLRASLFQAICDAGGSLPPIISPNSYIAKGVTIGQGTVIMHDVLINTNVMIGMNNIVNSKALIEHDSEIGNHNHVSTNAVINGNCTIYDSNFIGSGAVINQGKTIQNNIILASMSLVNRDIEISGTYAGTPAKRIK